MQSLLTPADISLDNISFLFNNNINVSVLRLDKIHPLISGNKWYKLRYYLEEAIAQHKKGIVTFGGAWSNHILATAAICQLNGLSSVGIIRGEEPAEWSPTLLQAKELGMQLIFISREAYKDKKIPAEFSTDHYLINEGGYGETGAKGAATILDGYATDFTHYCCAVGTGTMMAGLINATTRKKITGISVMKNNKQLEGLIQSLVTEKETEEPSAWELLHDYHFGGYAKYEPLLLQFMNDFYRQTNIPTDFVYTGKLFYAVSDLIKKDYFPPGSKILVIHSGGLQGNTSLHKGTLMF